MISADRAEHQSPEEGGANVISFNLILINKKLLDKGYISTQSYNILTFEQVCGDEKSDLCLSIFHQIYENLNKFKPTDLPAKYHHLSFEFVDLNDGKMIYALLQCSAFSYKYHPYCRYTCSRGSKGTCKLLNHEEYSKLYRKSERHFEASLKKLKVNDLDEVNDTKFKKIMEDHRI